MSEEDAMGRIGDEPIRPRFPIHVSLFGVAAVILPEVEYRALIDRNGDVPTGSRLTRLDKDQEVRAFIYARLGTDDVDRIREAAIERFGKDRVPSRSAINRAVRKIRTKEVMRRLRDV